jgi:alpha-L-rhamnosidase
LSVRLKQEIRRIGIAVVDLRTEFVSEPLGVETRKPQLSWRIESDRRGVHQSAYQIEVATSHERSIAGQPDLWDSGRVASDKSVGIRYGGAELASRQQCFWRVRVWDERDVASSPSATSCWEMGLLDVSDWSSFWLAAEDQTMREDREMGFGWVRGPASSSGGTTKFRLVFSIPTAAEATLFVAANGDLDIWMDDVIATSSATDPFTLGLKPTRELLTSLSAGTHVLGVAVGGPDSRLEAIGFHGGTLGFRDIEMAPFMRIRLPNGGMLRLGNKGWKTSLSSETNWRAVHFDDRHWDDAKPVCERRPQPWPPQRAILMRRAFSISKPVRRARIYAVALGCYEIHLNGIRVGDALLTPESTDFRKRALYRVYAITEQVALGKNALGAVVGDGWYASHTLAAGRYPWGPMPRCLLVQLELVFADGSREIIGSGPEWKASYAPIVSSEIYDGEFYDARLEQPGWSTERFDASHWWPAQVVPAPSVALIGQISPPIRREMVLTARRVTAPQPDVFVFDFGQNFSGWCRLKVKGPAGTVIEMRFGELIKGDGEIDQSNLGVARATDTYILKGDLAGETFEPHFTYHGFRYIQVTGFPGIPAADNIQGIIIRSDLKLSGRLNVENPVIQQIWQNTQWSQRSNFMGIPTDCPQRSERLGWMGDANVFWDAAAFSMDVDAFTCRFMGDVRDAQVDDVFADFNPAAFRFLRINHEKIGVLPNWATPSISGRIGASPGWADAGISLPWIVWQRYADTGIIDENWQAMARYLKSIHDSNRDLIWRDDRGVDYSDWLALDAKSLWDEATPKELVATALWANSVAYMAQMAEATARAADALHYQSLWASIATAFQRNFVAADGAVGNGSQTGYVLSLYSNLVPQALRPAAAAKLVADIKGRGSLLSTGFLGTPNCLDVLADEGYSDLVYNLLLRTEFPSWGYMIAQGATTIWESWNSDRQNLSRNHYALGAVCGFLFRRIAGIAPLEPGFKKIALHPVLDPRVKRGGGEYTSVLGKISTDWHQHDAGGFSLDLTVPPNATALVYLPATQAMTVAEGGQIISCNEDIRGIRRTSQQAIIEVGSGSYRFTVSYKESVPRSTGSRGDG